MLSDEIVGSTAGELVLNRRYVDHQISATRLADTWRTPSFIIRNRRAHESGRAALIHATFDGGRDDDVRLGICHMRESAFALNALRRDKLSREPARKFGGVDEARTRDLRRDRPAF